MRRKGSVAKYKYRPIIPQRDEKGRILTYLTTTEGNIKIEKNTLKEARLFAMILD